MSELKRIYCTMSDVMADIGAIGKNQVNSFQKYKFRGIDDVMNALYPVLCKHRVIIEPKMLDSKMETITTKDGNIQLHALVTMQYRFYAPDGSYVEAVTLGEGLDTSDKACNKAMAVAMKYAMFQTFCIPTEEMRMADLDNYSIQRDDAPFCEECGKPVTAVEVDSKTGLKVKYTVTDLSEKSRAKYGKCLCWDCSVKRSQEAKK